MNEFETFSVGFGNNQGQTTIRVLEERKNRIEMTNLKPTQIDHPKIQVRKYNSIQLGTLNECIRKKRDQAILAELLKVDLNCNVDEIRTHSERIYNKIGNDLVVLNAMMEENNTQKFIKKTKASGKQAKKYLSKYKSCDQAVTQYQKHQQLIIKFMQQNECDRENAVLFLQSNNYNESLLF